MNWKQISQTLALNAAGIGALGLAGWIFGIESFKRVHPALVTMKANTAICLIFAGVAVALLREENANALKRRVGQAFAVVIAVIGALSLGEDCFGWNFGIDQALFHETLEEAGRSIPGRMGPATALIFILLGCGILLLDVRTLGAWPAQCCATSAMAITVVVFLGYFYDVEMPAWMVLYASIALHTVLAFLLLCAALLLARPERGFIAVFLAEDTGGIVARRLLPSALLVPSLLGWLFVRGREAGYYGKGVGVALLAASVTAIFTTLVWWIARTLERTDLRRRKAEVDLRRSEHELSDFFENAAVALHWVGPDGIVLRANATELTMLGFTRDEYVGHNIAEFHVSDQVIKDILARLASAETLTSFPAQLRRKDGVVRDVLIDTSVYREDGKFVHTRCFTRDVTELKRTENARAQLAAIVASSGDAIVSKSLEGIVTSWNAGAQRLFGYSPDEMIGQPIMRIIPADRIEEERDILRRICAGEGVDHFETIRVNKEGRRISVSVTISPIRDHAGAIIGASKIARDITPQKQFEADLRAARDAAESANRTKDEFLAALSHELRTPLAPVLLLAADMEHAEELPEAVRADFAMIRKNVDLEARIIDDLLDLTRITRGKMTLRFEAVDLHGLVDHALSILRSQQAAKNLAIDLDLGAGANHVSGDSVRLQQVCWNVLKNAIKFTPAGGRISVRSWNEREHLRLAIADTGLGITAEEMPRIFTAFAQGSEARSNFGGLGLGLSIAALLVREHRGRIWAESAGRDQGATFHLELPLAAAPPPRALELSHHESPSGGSLRILLVEDHEDTRRVLQRLMTRWGHQVTAAATVAEARGQIARETFDLVLSDLGLPDGAGFDVVRAAREKSDIPVIAMSGYGMEADLAHTHAAGFDEHIVKPVSAERLRELLAQFAASAGDAQRS